MLKHAAILLLIYAIDVTLAIVGIAYAFNLTVQNWWAIIFITFLGRWVWNAVIGMYKQYNETSNSNQPKDHK